MLRELACVDLMVVLGVQEFEGELASWGGNKKRGLKGGVVL